MKRRTISLAGLACAVFLGLIQPATAQKATYGVRAGINFQNINGKNSSGGTLDSYKIKTGFNIGVNAEVPVAPDFYVQPGLLFTTKGAKAKSGDGKINISYIEIPVNFLYKPVLGDGKLLLGLGPYLAFGVGGKLKNGSESTDIHFKNSVSLSDYNSGNLYLRRLDAGANFLAGYEMSNHLSLQLNAQWGLVKINPSMNDNAGDDQSSWKNTGFGISAGYRF